MFKIEKSIPLPSKGQGTGMSKEVRDTLIAMEIGDSFVCNVKEYHVFGSIKKYTDFKPKEFSARSEGENYRVFRIK